MVITVTNLYQKKKEYVYQLLKLSDRSFIMILVTGFSLPFTFNHTSDDYINIAVYAIMSFTFLIIGLYLRNQGLSVIDHLDSLDSE